VIEWRLTADDVSRIRFAFSPLTEMVLSLVVLQAPAQHALQLPWVRATQPRLAEVPLADVLPLVPAHGIVADFLSPPPSTPLPDIAAELDLLRETSPERALADLADVPDVPPAVLHNVRADPAGAVARVVDGLQAYWDVVFAPIWPRVRTLLEADVIWRARRLTIGGATALFADLHPTVSWDGDRLRAADAWDHSGTPSGDGVLLVPSAMTWPGVRKMIAPYQATLVYPARGVATLWETGPPPSPDALVALLGRTRAHLLTALAEPASTTTLARRLSLTRGAVSQHLQILHANGLVSRSRVDAFVLYQRTPRGDSLTSSIHGQTAETGSR
jgi:DNA-binding transcriptional ArsR family regulator